MSVNGGGYTISAETLPSNAIGILASGKAAASLGANTEPSTLHWHVICTVRVTRGGHLICFLFYFLPLSICHRYGFPLLLLSEITTFGAVSWRAFYLWDLLLSVSRRRKGREEKEQRDQGSGSFDPTRLMRVWNGFSLLPLLFHSTLDPSVRRDGTAPCPSSATSIKWLYF